MTTLSQVKIAERVRFRETFKHSQFIDHSRIEDFIDEAIDTAVRTAFRETEVKEISEERLPYENSPEIYGNQRLESYKKGNHAALAEKTKLEKEFINS